MLTSCISDLDLFCPRCKEYFTAPPELTYHSCSNQTIKADELFCKKCKTGFDTRPELKYHDCRQDHYCRECDKCFDSPNELMKHECGQEQNGKEKELKSNLSQVPIFSRGEKKTEIKWLMTFQTDTNFTNYV
jgi:hypothetical protein